MKLILFVFLISSSFLFADNSSLKQKNQVVAEEAFSNYTSSFNFEETINVIEKELKTLGIPIFAEFDHYQNAKEVNLDLRKTTVIVFGSPKVGTLLMQANQNIALELPLKLLVMEDNSGNTIVRFKKMKYTAKEYNLENNEIVVKIDQLLENIAQKLIK
ncbi:DUF302 domain-containing protein [Fusobacterium varium]|uniref:DUF302 domain-containing protein n=1 Tax=Fusobacterium TaxID=848 RepID=UPI00102F610B|nr:DUF302 domain-containing protein [Fusobacterium ulcerans]